MNTRTKTSRPTTGFGCSTEDPHHFVVTLPTDHQAPVLIAEHFDSLVPGGQKIVKRCVLPCSLWAAFAEYVRAEFNRRLKAAHLPTSQWKIGDNHVERLTGKELLVLAWAVEQAELPAVPQAVRNWQGLQPEERWLATLHDDRRGHRWNQ